MSDERTSRIEDFNRQRIAEIAKELRRIAGEVEGWSKKLDEEKFAGTLSVDGGRAVYTSMKSIDVWLGKCQTHHKAAQSLSSKRTNGKK